MIQGSVFIDAENRSTFLLLQNSL